MLKGNKTIMMKLIYVRQFAVWLFILGVYTSAPLKIGDMPIPAILAGVSGLFLLAINISQIKKQHVMLLIGLGCLTVLGFVANFGDGAEIARLKGAVQLLYSVTISYGLFLELRGWGKHRVANLFQALAFIVVLGCILELYTDFRDWSDSFRTHVFEHNILYNSDFRDQLVFGKVRPKLFTTEPSYVAIFFLLSMTMWVTLTNATLVPSWKYFLLAITGSFLIGSPFVLLTALVPMLNYFFLKEKGWNLMKFYVEEGVLKKLLAVSLYSSVLLFVMLGIWHKVEIGHKAEIGNKAEIGHEPIAAKNRLEQTLNGSEDSFKIRLTAPPIIARDILSKSPLFGVGLEAKVTLNKTVLGVFKQLGIQTDYLETNRLGWSVTNNFWLHWIYWGVLGGLLVIFWMYWLMKLIGVHYPLYCFVIITMFSQTMGGYVAPKFWFICFLSMLVGALHNSTKSEIVK